MPIFNKNPCISMITYTPASERRLALFTTPFDQKLDPENRWVKMADMVPWDAMAKVFYSRMSKDVGRSSVDLRVVLGALLVKHIEGLSDEDAILYIQENIYAQYFVGLPSFQTRPVFVPSLFVEIRKRLGKQGALELNEAVLKQARQLQMIRHTKKPSRKAQDQGKDQKEDQTTKDTPGEGETNKNDNPAQESNRGTLKVDATVAPQHIGYPTDTNLLQKARLYSEALIDKLYQGSQLWGKKPRTYRRQAHKEYLAFSKKRRVSAKEIRRQRRKQLQYLRRNLGHINQMLDLLKQEQEPVNWDSQDWRRFWVLQELYRQQDILHKDARKQIEDRIVNIAQPYVRPIKRGKAGKDTEFGAKLNVSETEGFLRIDQISFNNFNEGICLQQQVEDYKRLYGYYPELVLADRAYLNRENRNYLKSKDIRHSGAPLGRPPEMSAHQKLRRKKEQNKRSEIEGKFGQGKSKYGLDDIKTKLMDTSYACVGLIMLALNIIKMGKEAIFGLLTRILPVVIWVDIAKKMRCLYSKFTGGINLHHQAFLPSSYQPITLDF
jgi:hypothetical protein